MADPGSSDKNSPVSKRELFALTLGILGAIVGTVLAFVVEHPEIAFVVSTVVVGGAGLLAASRAHAMEQRERVQKETVDQLTGELADCKEARLVARLDATDRWADLLAHNALMAEVESLRKEIESLKL